MTESNQKTVEVITAVVDTVELTLYLKDGNTLSIKQGDSRVKRIVDEITPVLVTGGIARVNLDYDKTHEFADFEEKTGGIVKFFRVAKTKLKRFLNRTEALFVGELVQPQTIGRSDEPEDEGSKEDSSLVPARDLTPVERMQQATDDIMKHAVPVTDHHFADHQVSDEQDKHALVAVVDNKVIPNVQHLHSQIKHINQGGDSEGLVNLMKRVAAVKRGHSVDDLMKFLKKGDLPIAKDGSIIIYKRLESNKTEKGDYVDVHSRQVHQRVGDIVCMAESMVDHNRRVDCSNGLHVARRQYLGGFSGNKMILAKVNPEDVIAVPEYDANKMRVCSYHILFEVPEADAQKLIRNQPIQPTDETGILLARALAGDFPPAVRRVEITEGKGGGLIFTDLTYDNAVKHEPKVDLAPVGALEDQSIIDPAMTTAPAVPVADVVDKIQPKTAAPKAETHEEMVVNLMTIIMEGGTSLERLDAAKELMGLRKKWKKSWAALEITEKGVKAIDKALATDPTVAKVQPVSKKKVIVKGKLAEKQAPSNKSAVQPKAAGVAQKPAKVPKDVAAPGPVQVTDDPTAGPSKRIAAQLEGALAGDKSLALLIFEIKKAAKKSWDKLGVTEVQLRKLELLLGKK